MIQRRSFIAGILASGFAPAIGHAGILMPVKKIVVPEGDPPQGWIRVAGYEPYKSGGGFIRYNGLTTTSDMIAALTAFVIGLGESHAGGPVEVVHLPFDQHVFDYSDPMAVHGYIGWRRLRNLT